MSRSTRRKLILTWFALGLAALGALRLTGFFQADKSALSAITVVVLLIFFLLISFFIAYFWLRSWSRRIDSLRSFVAALPDSDVRLPEGGPEEVRKLARNLQEMGDDVRKNIQRANVEFSRRETVLAGMAEGVLAVDRNLHVIFCNEALARAFRIRVPLAEGLSFLEVVRQPELHEILIDVTRSGAVRKSRLQLSAADGRWFEIHALPIGHEPRSGAIVVLHDITDIERQEQARKDFVANVSHELRTPLAAIRGYAETLLHGGLEDKEHNRLFVETILAHSIRLNNIATDLLVLSELDANAPASEPERVDVLEVVNSALRTVESSAGLRGVRLVRDECQECAILGHRFRLEQAVVNLLDNAVKFNQPDGEVRIQCGYTDDERVRIAVTDTGIGIPSEDLKRIFERFYRVDKARSRKAGGTGLGLPIVKEIIERMGGTVSVESQLGKGSTFILFLQPFEK